MMELGARMKCAVASALLLAMSLFHVSATDAAGPSHVVEVKVAGTGTGNTNADVIVNGVMVILDHLVVAARRRGTDTLTATVNGQVQSVEVRFDNDAVGNNLYLYSVKVDGVPVPLTDGVVVRASNGAVTPVSNGSEVALIYNSSFQADVGGRANNWFQADRSFNWGGGETEAKVDALLAGRSRPVRFDGAGRLLDDTPANSTVIEVPSGLSGTVAYIEQEFKNRKISRSVTGAHVTVRLAPGVHRFEKRLWFKRGNITLEGAGMGQTTIVHDFPVGQTIDHALEFRAGAILGARVGFTANEVVPDDQLLPNITIRDFTITYQITDSDISDSEIAEGLTAQDLREIGSQNFVPRYAVADNRRGGLGTTLWQQQAAIALDGVIEANVTNLRGRMVGSHFIGIHESRGVYADGLVADGTLNRGGGGNGYALELIQTHGSVIKFDAVVDYRHISVNNDGAVTSPDIPVNWSTNNVIAAEYSNTNMDFHTQSEKDNILYAESLVANPYIQAQPVGPNGELGFVGEWTWSYRLDDERMAWDMFDPRHLDSAVNNKWFADNLIGAGNLNRTGEAVGGRIVQIVDTDHDYYEEELHASANDGYIYSGYDDDLLVAGSGRNTFVFTDDPGHDTIQGFGPEDRIALEIGTLGIASMSDLLSSGRVSSADGDVHINLGPQQITIEDAAGFFSIGTHAEVDDHTFYSPGDKDFAFPKSLIGR